jgi:hypothetical protein
MSWLLRVGVICSHIKCYHTRIYCNTQYDNFPRSLAAPEFSSRRRGEWKVSPKLEKKKTILLTSLTQHCISCHIQTHCPASHEITSERRLAYKNQMIIGYLHSPIYRLQKLGTGRLKWICKKISTQFYSYMESKLNFCFRPVPSQIF